MSNHSSEEVVNTNQARRGRNNNLDMQTLMVEMRRMVREEMGAVNERIDTIQESVNQGLLPNTAARRRRARPQEEADEDDLNYYSRGSQASNRSERRSRRVREARGRNEDNLSGLKLKIPPFHGKNDPDVYLEWEKKIELVFDCQNYSEQKKVQVAATEFYDYAINWWDQIVTSRRRNREPPVSTCEELKNLMRKRFVPSHYHWELHQKLRRLTQGSKSVEDYYQEMESLMLKADIEEDVEATMARFLSGLARDIQDRMELQTYNDLEEMLHKAVLVEQQTKRRSTSKLSYGAGAANTRTSYSREDRTVTKPKPDPKPYANTEDAKGKAVATSSRNRDVKCFKCQGRGHYANECTNKRTMTLLDNGEIETEEEKLESEGETEDEGIELPAIGELLVTRRSLSIQVKDTVQEQRENLFHTRCLVQGKVCSLIIDGGSCTNVASETMVKKLGLEVKKHPKPFKLQWLNDAGEMIVSSQVLVPLTIGKYEDEILCDILPMEAGHILLGRPWQFDRRVLHDGFTNRYSFEFNGRKTILAPLAPHEVHQDQLKLKHQEKTIVREPLNTPPQNKNESLRKTKKKACESKPVRHSNFFVRSNVVKRALFSQQPVLLFVYKETLLNLTNPVPE